MNDEAQLDSASDQMKVRSQEVYIQKTIIVNKWKSRMNCSTSLRSSSQSW